MITENTMEKDKKLIMITGSNKGIGLGLIKKILNTDPLYRIFMCVRSMERGKAALEELKQNFPNAESHVLIHNLDIADSKSIDEFVDWVKSSKTQIDCLINNAAVLTRTNEVNIDLVNKTFPTNYYGTIELTEKMLPFMTNNSKIIFITSSLGTYKHLTYCKFKERLKNPKLTRKELKNIVDEFCNEVKCNNSPIITGEYPVYGFTKLALNCYTRILSKEKAIEDKDIQVYACHPGWVKTDIGGPNAILTIEQGIECPYYLLNLPWTINENLQGKFFAKCQSQEVF